MKRIKIVQIENFYASFLEQFYNNHIGLRERPFLEQMRSLLESGYSGGHNVVPYLDSSRWSSYYIIYNNLHTQNRWLLEQGIYANNLSLAQILEMQILQIKPDVIYLSDVFSFDFGILDQLNPKPLIVGWHATVVDDRIPWHKVDLLLSGIDTIRQRASELGAQAVKNYMPAAPAYSTAWFNVETPNCNVVFSGSFSGSIHTARIDEFKTLSRSLDTQALHIFTSSPFSVSSDESITFHPPVFGRDVLDLYSRSKIVLDSRGDFGLEELNERRETSNMRIFEATRAGSLLITEDCSNLTQYFNVGQEIEVSRSTEELIDKVRYYLSPQNTESRERMAAAGYARVMSEHLIEHRAQWFDRLITEALLEKASSTRSHDKSNEISHLITTVASSESLIFCAALVFHLMQRFSPMAIQIICLDDLTKAYFMQMGLSTKLITLREVELWEYTHFGESKNAISFDLAPARWLLYTISQNPACSRLTYLDCSLYPDDLGLLDFAQDDHTNYILSYQLSHRLAYENEIHGDTALAFFSIDTVTNPKIWLEKLIEHSSLDSYSSLQKAQKTVDEWLASTETSVAKLPIKGAWNFDLVDPALSQSIRFFPLLNRRKNGVWEFLTHEEFTDWSNCYTQYYLPYMSLVEQLISLYSGLNLPDQIMPSSQSVLTDLLLQRYIRQQRGFRLLTQDEFQAWTYSESGWDTPEVAMIQHSAFVGLLQRYKLGDRRIDLAAMEKIMRRITSPGASILEVGCGSGYNVVFLRDTVCEDISYTGIDTARAMIALAERSGYSRCAFAVMAAESLDFASDAFNIVLNGASLMHTIHYERAITEASRVAHDYVVLHTVTVSDAEQNIYFEKQAYGSVVPEVVFSSRYLIELLERNDLIPLFMEQSIDYDLQSIVNVPTRSISLACLHHKGYLLSAGRTERNYYCTYFDAHYLPRGVAMIRSLRRHDPLAQIFVLCFDETTESYVKSMGAGVIAISTVELCAADIEFAETRNNRSRIEWYFTATSVLPHYLIRRFPEIPRITYLDSDLYFYCSPEPLHHEATDASVQIIEHRFSAHLAPLEVYGRFNVAWISFFNTPEGNQVIDEYRSECIEWCYDHLEETRFADQKYLDTWPARYANCNVSQLLGGNVAPWNLARWHADRVGDQLFVDGERLLFYHFHGVKRLESGEYYAGADMATFGEYFGSLYSTYISLLGAIETELAPLLEKSERREIRYPKPGS